MDPVCGRETRSVNYGSDSMTCSTETVERFRRYKQTTNVKERLGLLVLQQYGDKYLNERRGTYKGGDSPGCIPV